MGTEWPSGVHVCMCACVHVCMCVCGAGDLLEKSVSCFVGFNASYLGCLAFARLTGVVLAMADVLSQPTTIDLFCSGEGVVAQDAPPVRVECPMKRVAWPT